ncbi:MAG: acyl-phosphate glycerol 3-phosphate acyltransferase [Alphaproteobacteria bacterium CG_4_10_14_0_2_um_filter_63_37]|nr:MAG: hypothetical protein AUJ55_12000 [Proteobacteria bacterium CG1_02_64_396]PJA26046.1 MAG: acyl-phosphate glycerol 3-phosphate acyltransferase [Alphaproteobacteria bacterium CG_4_10_14_0_2_um_filter_63_37]
MTESLELLSIALAAYLLGSVPTGVVVARVMGMGDLRQSGSGNIGATNALRVGGKKAGALTLIGDMLKGAAAVLLALGLSDHPLAGVAAAGAAVLGHLFPVFLGFKGGKGVATGLGVFAVLHPLATGAAVASWLATFMATKISSLSALVALLVLPAVVWFSGAEPAMRWLAVCLCLLIVFKHHSNIRRLIQGTEPRFGRKGEG